MPQVTPIQDDFSSGEISPRLHGRTRSEIYATGLAHCENFEVTPQGSLKMRNGTQIIGDIGEAQAVLHTFRREVEEDVTVVVGLENITLWNKSGRLESGEAINIVRDPTFESGLAFWDVEEGPRGTATPLPGTGVNLRAIQPALFPGLIGISQTMAVVPTNNTRVQLKFVLNDLVDQSFSRSGYVRITIYEGEGGSENILDTVTHTYPNASIDPPGTIVEYNEVLIPALSTLRLRVHIESPYTLDTNLQTEMDVNVYDIGVFDETVGGGVTTWPTPADWVSRGVLTLRLIQSVTDTAEARMFFTVFEGTMHELVFDAETNIWNFSIFAPTKTDGIDWTDNQPSVCTFHQGRLWLAGSPNNRSALWASKTFNYDDFDAGAADDDGLEFELSSAASIAWIHGLKFLLIGTESGEVIGRSSGAVITAADFDFPRESAWGSLPVRPEEVGNSVIYISSDRSKLRSLFDGGDTTNSYESVEITLKAEHLFRGLINDAKYAQNPNYQMYTLLASNEFAVTTLVPALDMEACYRMTMSDPITAVASSNDTTGTSTWMLVNRLDGTGTGDRSLHLEVKNASDAAEYNMDSYIIQPFIGATVTGLDELNDYVCSVVLLSTIDGSLTYTVHPDRQPVDGEIELEEWADADTVVVGIGYEAIARTLPLEGTAQAGTAQIQKRRFNEIFLRLLNSAIPLVNGARPPLRMPAAPMNLSQPLMTGDSSQYNAGWDDGAIEIVQDLPLPTHITAIFGKAKGNNI